MGSRNPKLVAELRKSPYVVDLITGETTVKETQQLKQSASEIFHDDTFTLHKWYSNALELEEESTNRTGKETIAKQQLRIPGGGDYSLLELSCKKDVDEITVFVPPENGTTTKRRVLCKLSKIYDPLGLASPIILQGKSTYREACETKMAWNVPLGSELMKKWLCWENALPERPTAPRTLAMFEEEVEPGWTGKRLQAVVEGTRMASQGRQLASRYH